MAVTTTLSEFARLLGVEPSYITKLKQAGRLVLVNKRVDVEASKALIKQTEGGSHEPVRERWSEERAKKSPADPAESEPLTPETPADPDQNGVVPAYGSRAHWEKMDREEVYRIRRIERLKLEGSLVPIADVDFVLDDYGATLRGLLENMADRLAPQVYPMQTLEETRAVLSEAMEELEREIAATMSRRRAELSK